MLFLSNKRSLANRPVWAPIIFPLYVPFDANGGRSNGKPAQEIDLECRESEDRQLLCVACGQVITSESQRIAIDGKQVHDFTNPEGVDYRIGCFKSVTGVGRFEEATEEWTWFANYSWVIVSCASCFRHLGWYYKNQSENSFYGLILKHLKQGLDKE